MSFLQGWKQGLKDVGDAFQEGNYKLFAKQVVVIVAVFMLVRWASGRLDEQTKSVRQQIESIRVQQSSEQEYLANKSKLMSLEPQFPDISVKDQWLIQQLFEVFKPVKINANLSDPQMENANNPNYTIVSKKVNFAINFLDFGKLLAEVENRPFYLRVSEFSITKNPDSRDIGVNTVSLTFNTVFPKEKLAPVLFKDYKGGKK